MFGLSVSSFSAYYLKDLEEDSALAHYFSNVAIKTSRPEQVVGCLARNTSSGGQGMPTCLLDMQ